MVLAWDSTINLYLSILTQNKRTRAWDRGEYLHNSTEKGWQKEMAYLERAVCTFYTAAGPHLLHHQPFLSYFLTLVRLHSPSPCSLAPAEHLTRAHEKGSTLKGRCWAATPRMPAPVQSNKAGCLPLTGCLEGKTGSFLPVSSSVSGYFYNTF